MMYYCTTRRESPTSTRLYNIRKIAAQLFPLYDPLKILIKMALQNNPAKIFAHLFVLVAFASAFTVPLHTYSTSTELSAILSGEGRKNYVPKWKKKQTLAEEAPTLDLEAKGIKGTINVRFQQGNATKLYLARPGQPLRDVALQAGQFIKYGCGKGECGTCEALCNGKWIRPCTTVVPADLAAGSEYVVIVKEIKSKKTVTSGKFYSVRSFLVGFYTNVLGMIGFVAWRKKAKKNWSERQEYEDLIKQKALAKKLAKQNKDLAP